MPLGMQLGLDPGDIQDIVLDGDLASRKKGHSPHFSADVYCGQTAGWITMPLSRVHERYRQTTDRRQTDGRQHIANVNVSSRSLKMLYHKNK